MQNVLQKPRTILEVWEQLPEGTLCQLINNNIVMSPSPTDKHQQISGDIFYEMKTIIKKKSLGQIRLAPYDVHFSKKNILQPDIVFIEKENEYLIESKGLFGSPDIIVEILSPSPAHIDLGEKRDIYEHYGVKEYFIVDPNNKMVTSLILEGKEFKEMEETVGNFYSSILGSTITF
jgi:Uma2 family endonuclease